MSHTVAHELAPLLAALRGALRWHLETGDAALPVPEGFVLPALGEGEAARPGLDAEAASARARFEAPASKPTPVQEQGRDAPEAAPAPTIAAAIPELAPLSASAASALPPTLTWGNPWARTVFVLEAGSADTPVEHDAAGPLGGEAGVLLMRMIKAMKLGWRDVFLVCCVRDESPPPAEHWRKAIERALALAPRGAVVSMGVTMTHALLETDAAMPRLRGRRFERPDGAVVYPTFTPDALVQNPKLKAAAWEDLQRVMRSLEAR